MVFDALEKSRLYIWIVPVPDTIFVAFVYGKFSDFPAELKPPLAERSIFPPPIVHSSLTPGSFENGRESPLGTSTALSAILNEPPG